MNCAQRAPVASTACDAAELSESAESDMYFLHESRDEFEYHQAVNVPQTDRWSLRNGKRRAASSTGAGGSSPTK